MLLAAGRGERLRPLSDALPKPLLPVAGMTLAARSLRLLRAAGCEAVAVNLHHLGERIREQLGEELEGMSITYSPEEELQGTLGAVAPLDAFFAPVELAVIVNGDSLCDWPFEALIEAHLGSPETRATLLMSRRAEVSDFGGGVALDEHGRILRFRGPHPAADGSVLRVFAGAHVLSPQLFRGRPAAPADFIADLYQPLLDEAELIRGLETDLPWHDLGTPRRYLEAVLAWSGGGWVAPDARVATGATVSGSVIEAGAAIEDGALVEEAVVMAGSTIPRGAVVRASILGPGARLRTQQRIEKQLVTAAVGQPRLTPLGYGA